MTRRYWVVIGLVLIMAVVLGDQVSAAGLPEDDPNPADGRRVGLMSTSVGCLVVTSGALDSASATMRLEWEGQVEEAFLVLAVAGSQGGHSIYVNGRRVGSAPVRPGGQPCHVGSSAPPIMPTDSISIPADVLIKGENVVRVTNDANLEDGWTAANLYIEIHGVLSGPPVAVLEGPPPVLSRPSLAAPAPVLGTVLLTSTYELARGEIISQLVSYQIPVSYTGSVSVPLLIGISGMGSNGQVMRDFLAAEANNRGWLLAAPDRHGSYYVNTGMYALGWVGAQHDVIDTIEYMRSEYEVDPSHVYVTGGSMGGQEAAMMATKYPDVFAAGAPWKPLTDLTDWYNELAGLRDDIRSTIRKETGGRPSDVPFEYQRRSPMEMPQNSRLIPIRLWHDQQDVLVPIHHSYDLRDAINSYDPITPVVVIDPSIGGCPPYQHCYDPDLKELFDYLENFTSNFQPPSSLAIRTDESKPYYWLNLAQTGGDHWLELVAAYSLADNTATAHISDTKPLTLAFNLGATPTKGPGGINRSGMGLPETTYLLSGGGNYKLENYTSGYLTTTLSTTGQFTVTISTITAQVAADLAMVSGWHTTTSMITAVFQDHLNNPVPDGTIVQFSTSEGVFPNASATYTAAVKPGGQGQVTTTLALVPIADVLAEIAASVEGVTASTTVDVIHPDIDIRVAPHQTSIYRGESVTYTYQITNTGDITLTGVRVVDDGGPVCENIVLAVDGTQTCSRSVQLFQTTTSTVTATGQDPLGNDVTDRDSATVILTDAKIFLPVVTRD
jgi:pimeloyl-ACP methyl ester carboxylesterase